jgi:hypothetical protein
MEPSPVGEVGTHGVREGQDLTRDAPSLLGVLGERVHDGRDGRERLSLAERLSDGDLFVVAEDRDGHLVCGRLVDERVNDDDDRDLVAGCASALGRRTGLGRWLLHLWFASTPDLHREPLGRSLFRSPDELPLPTRSLKGPGRRRRCTSGGRGPSVACDPVSVAPAKGLGGEPNARALAARPSPRSRLHLARTSPGFKGLEGAGNTCSCRGIPCKSDIA